MTNLHTHTTYSDGADSIEETVKAAIAKGFSGIGISDHSVAPLGLYPGVEDGTLSAYTAEIRAAARKFGGLIEVYAGLENEYCNPLKAGGLDYVIGSVHYLKFGGGAEIYYCVDGTPEEFDEMLAEMFGGDCDKLARRYYGDVADMAASQRPDIIGHLDVITKFNGGGRLFDTQSGEYTRAVKEALDAISRTDCAIEINTGGMARGYTKQPYPEWHILEEILKMGLPVVIASDSHCAGHLDFAFAETVKRLRGMGFKSARRLVGGRFEDAGL